MDNKTARQDLEIVIRVEDLALGSMRKLRAIQDWLRAEAGQTEAPVIEQFPEETLIDWADSTISRLDPNGTGMVVHELAAAAMELISLVACSPATNLIPRGRVAVPRDVAEAHGMYLVGYSWLKHNAPQELIAPQPQTDGWKLMPMHATPEMIARGKRAHKEEFLYHEDADLNIQHVWKAMAAITPQPPQAQGLPKSDWVKCSDRMQSELLDAFENGDSADHYNVLRDFIYASGLNAQTNQENSNG